MTSPSRFRSIGELAASLGDVPLDRILLHPTPGTATVEDVVRLLHRHPKRLVELVNGTLVERVCASRDAVISATLGRWMGNAVKPEHLGWITDAGGPIQMANGNVRLPAVAFTRRADVPGGVLPREPAPRISPTITTEAWNVRNTPAELRIKLRDYFESGVKAVWVLDPDSEWCRVYDGPAQFHRLTRDDVLTGGNLLPGLSVRVGELFDI